MWRALRRLRGFENGVGCMIGDLGPEEAHIVLWSGNLDDDVYDSFYDLNNLLPPTF